MRLWGTYSNFRLIRYRQLPFEVQAAEQPQATIQRRCNAGFGWWMQTQPNYTGSATRRKSSDVSKVCIQRHQNAAASDSV